MTKNPSTTFGVEITVIENGKIRYAPDGKPEKKKIPMSPGKFADGKPHNFYNDDGVFKGMTRILQECGLTNEAKLNAECKNFKCAEGATRCCQRRVLYNQPDFAEQGSGLEILGQDFGFDFLPKFHCELNFIEQCWGHAKRVYRQYPVSSKEEDLEKNLLTALESVPLSVMRKYARRSRKFMDAYHKGLNGKQAAWASKKYRSHRVLPESLMDDMTKANL